MLPPPPHRSDPPGRRHRPSRIGAPKSKVQRLKWVLTNFDLPTKHLTDPDPTTRRTLMGRERPPSRRRRTLRAPHLAATTQRPAQRPTQRPTQRPISRSGTQRPISTTQRPKKNFPPLRGDFAPPCTLFLYQCCRRDFWAVWWGGAGGPGATGPRRAGRGGEGKGEGGEERREGKGEGGEREGERRIEKPGGPGGDPAATQRPTPTQRPTGPNAQNRTAPYGDHSTAARSRRCYEAARRVLWSSDHCSPPWTTQRPRDPTPNAQRPGRKVPRWQPALANRLGGP